MSPLPRTPDACGIFEQSIQIRLLDAFQSCAGASHITSGNFHGEVIRQLVTYIQRAGGRGTALGTRRCYLEAVGLQIASQPLLPSSCWWRRRSEFRRRDSTHAHVPSSACAGEVPSVQPQTVRQSAEPSLHGAVPRLQAPPGMPAANNIVMPIALSAAGHRLASSGWLAGGHCKACADAIDAVRVDMLVVP